MRRPLLVGFLLPVLAGVLCAAGADKVEETVESLYGAELRAVAATPDPADDLALAGRVLAAARAAAAQPALAVALADRAYDLGRAHPHGHAAAEAALELIVAKAPARRAGTLDRLVDLRQRAYTRLRGEERVAAGAALMAALRRLGDAHAEAYAFDDAADAYRRAVGVATALHSDARAALQARRRALQEQTRVGHLLDRLREEIEKDPANAAAREGLVQLLLIELDDPEAAARHIDETCKEDLRKYVPAAARGAAAAPELACFELGEWYRALAEKASRTARPALLERAKAYYARFLELHEEADLDRTAAKLALSKIERELDASIPAVEPAPASPTPRPVSRPSKRTAGGEPLGPLALVSAPAKLRGVESWTIETRRPRGAVTAIAFMPDGETLVAAHDTGALRLLDAATGEMKRVLVGGDEMAVQLWVSPTGGRLALRTEQRLRLWDLKAGRPGPIVEAADRHAVVQWSPDGRWLAVGDAGVVHLCDPVTGEVRANIPFQGRVKQLAWSPNGCLLLAGEGTRATPLELRDARSGQVVRTLALPMTVTNAGWMPDGRRVYLEESLPKPKARLLLVDAASGAILARSKVTVGAARNVYAAADGRSVLWVEKTGAVRTFDAASLEASALFAIRTADRRFADTDYSAGRHRLAACADTGRVSHLKLWDAGPGSPVWTAEHRPPALSDALWIEDRDLLIVCLERGQAEGRAWRVADGSGVPLAWSFEGLARVQAFPDGARLFLGGGRRAVLASLDEGRVLWHKRTSAPPGALSPDGALRIDGNGVVWRIADGSRVSELGRLRRAAWSPDGRRLVVLRPNSSSFEVWDTSTWTNLGESAKHGGHPGAYAWSPDSRFVASTSRLFGRSGVHVTRGEDGRPILRFGPKQGFGALAWSPDGRTLAAGHSAHHRGLADPYGPIRLFNPVTGAETGLLEGHATGVRHLAFSGDGRRLLSVSAREARIWDLGAGTPLVTFAFLTGGGELVVDAAGHIRPSEGVDLEKEILYIVETLAGLETLSPSQMQAKYGWVNDPSKVGLE